jgi:peroxiredoxin
VRIAGCSTDTLEAQQAFADKIGSLRFPLIADPDAKIARAYDAYKEEWKVSGRTTVLIGEDGTVLLAWPEAPVNAQGHVEAVYGEVAKLFGR